jgi:uncharacterized protein YoxC
MTDAIIAIFIIAGAFTAFAIFVVATLKEGGWW